MFQNLSTLLSSSPSLCHFHTCELAYNNIIYVTFLHFLWYHKIKFIWCLENCKKHFFNNVIQKLTQSSDMAVQRILLEWISGKIWTAIIFAIYGSNCSVFKHFITKCVLNKFIVENTRMLHKIFC